MNIRVIYLLFFCLLILSSASGRCPNNCNGHGTCDKFSRCLCGNGYQGADCSEHICPLGAAWVDQATAVDIAHGLTECSNKGICDRENGRCICADGFAGTACERLSCPNNCNDVGKCMTMSKRAQYTRNDNSQQFSYTSVWDANKIQGCVCDPGFAGYDCSERVCPVGDDPLTTGQVNEVQLLQCLSSAGSFAVYFYGIPTSWIPIAASASDVAAAIAGHPLITAASVTFAPGYSSVCAMSANVVRIEFTQDFGALPPLVPLLSQAMQDVGGSVVVSADGYTPLTDGAGNVYTSTKGTKESALCSNRGICDRSSGVCSCFQTFGDVYDSSDGSGGPGRRGDCGWVRSSSAATVSSCPGEIQCSAHGTCNGTALVYGMNGSYTCACQVGWSAGDCSERSCPRGLSWFDYPSAVDAAHTSYAECSNMGLCDRSTGQCQCRESFFGRACEYMNCPGDVGNTCSGHGRCMSMSHLAQVATTPLGELGGFSYGSDPNNPATWDADRVLGCLCDAGYGGYDCSLLECPTGDDPGSYEDHAEVQLLQCTATDGYFTLRFRDYTTSPISVNGTTVDAFLHILSGIPSLSYGDLVVYFSLGGMPPNATFYISPPPLPGIPSDLSTGHPTPSPTESPTEVPTILALLTLPPVNSSQPTYEPTSDPTVSPSDIPTVVPTPGPTSAPFVVNSTVCSTDGSQVVVVEFRGISGALPPLRVDASHLRDSVNANGNDGTGVVTVFTSGQSIGNLRSLTGTTENDVCNNRGLCDATTGRCSCFRDWGSSDGNGNIGGRADCGYRRDDYNAPQ